MRQELIDAARTSTNPEIFLLGAEWMEAYLNPTSDDIIVNSSDYTVSFEGKKLRLPKKEFEVLKYLQNHCGKIVTRDELLNKLWPGVCVTPRTVDVHIRLIRSKITILPIRTVKKVGYMWEEEMPTEQPPKI
jgi:DNA-binding response OmpR family regulator